MEPYITLTPESIQDEHICCAFSDKKCVQSYEAKKSWLTDQFANGYVFRRLDARAKVFIEYGPAETAWVPVTAPDYLMIGCFWVSGKYKNSGHGKALLHEAIDTAKRDGKAGLATVAGSKKFHFMSDTKWLLRQGFTERDITPTGFSLIALDLGTPKVQPHFNRSVKESKVPVNNGCLVYYSNRCPYSEYHVQVSLPETCDKRGIPLTVIKIESLEQAQSAPIPATIFSLFMDGKFVTTDISVCMDTRFDKIVGQR